MLSSCIKYIHANVRNVKSVRRYCRINDKKNGAVTHAFKLLKVKYLNHEVFVKDNDDDSDTDDDSSVVLNHEDDPEIKYFKSFYKALPLYYPLTLSWTKIPCPSSKLCNHRVRNIKL